MLLVLTPTYQRLLTNSLLYKRDIMSSEPGGNLLEVNRTHIQGLGWLARIMYILYILLAIAAIYFDAKSTKYENLYYRTLCKTAKPGIIDPTKCDQEKLSNLRLIFEGR